MPRYSIVITTVDRPAILKDCLAATLALERSDIEVLVSDNFSDERTAAVIEGFQDQRLRKFRTDRRMPMPDHWEWIWQQTRGDYVIYIGDDSTLTEAALRAADRAIDAYDADIVSWRAAHYYHADWKVKFRHLPDRGNILAIDMGFSNGLYRVDTDAVIRHFCETLRLSGCFPSVIGFLVKRDIGNAVIRETGRFHWAPCPDISASLMALVRAGQGRFYFWDGLGGLGGRSGDSNVASLLSKGKASKRLREWLDEFPSGEERFPDHPYALESITNLLAAAITQTKTHYPERFPDHYYDMQTLILRSIDDAYRDLTVPWADDETFIAELESLIEGQAPAEQEAARASLESARAELRAFIDSGGDHFNPTPDPQGTGLLDMAAALAKDPDGRNRRLFMKTRRNPHNRYWNYAGSTFIDMELFGSRTIHGARDALPVILEEFEPDEPTFLPQYRQFGMLGDALETLKP
ncbi:MAG: glycosyltransferase [Pseudomonadota bacterium]